MDPQIRVSDRSRSPQEREGSRRQVHNNRDMIRHSKEERKLLLKGNRVNHRRRRSTGLLIQVKTMKSLKMNLEPLQILNLLHQCFLAILVMKTVNTARNTVHKVRILEGQYSIRSLLFDK